MDSIALTIQTQMCDFFTNMFVYVPQLYYSYNLQQIIMHALTFYCILDAVISPFLLIIVKKLCSL